MHTKFIQLVHSKWKFNLFLLKNLPSAYFSGVRVRSLTEAACSVTVPYQWFSRNPFNSTYFACLAMAAEMSTGVLALGNIYGQKPGISMLVVALQATYYKKAIGITTFTCADGAAFANAIQQAKLSGESHTVTSISNGYNNANELVASFTITWSFKAKKGISV